jgi:NAD(P)-dependent dehydrogenase (short-subunit alcohol dehydrogenase family)
MHRDLEGIRVVISGGAGLIGRAFTAACAGAGARVVVADTDSTSGEPFTEEVRRKTGSRYPVFYPCDITDTHGVREMIGFSLEEMGGIDALVNSAYPRNANFGRAFEEVTYEDFCENISLHLGGYFNITREVAKTMMERKRGNIINMASIYGIAAPRFEIYEDTGMTNAVEYAATKGGILAMTRYLASYLGRYQIRVNAISPGGVENLQNPAFVKRYTERVVLGKRMASTDDITGVLLFLLSDASRYITGQNLVVDGGWTL